MAADLSDVLLKRIAAIASDAQAAFAELLAMRLELQHLRAEREGWREKGGDEVAQWLRELQLLAGHALTQLTSNHPKYRTFETIHREAASAQLASHRVTNTAGGRDAAQ